jgi:hypothetical protein
MTKIAVVNRSSVISDTEVSRITNAPQKQVVNDFAPIWGQGADLVFVGSHDTGLGEAGAVLNSRKRAATALRSAEQTLQLVSALTPTGHTPTT